MPDDNTRLRYVSWRTKMPDDNTRDIAVKALSEIQSHSGVCAQRAAESNQRMERLFAYIKEAHDDTGDQIADIVKDVGDIKQALIVASSGTQQITQLTRKVEDIQTTLSEQRGAGKAMKVIWGVGVAALSTAGGLLGGKLGH